jgi:hypothetical protein
MNEESVRMPDDELWAIVEDHYDQILATYGQFAENKPIILLDIQDDRIYAYPYEGFKADLSPRNQASLTDQYEQASASDGIVVFVRDNDRKKLVSYTIDME